MVETRKRQVLEENDVESMKKQSRVIKTECGGGTNDQAFGDEDIMAWLSMDDETMDELMNYLDTTNAAAAAGGGATATHATTTTAPSRVKFIDNPYSSSLIFQSSSSYVTINGNEESCGSSFSDSDSSVMASVDMGGIVMNVVHDYDDSVVWAHEGFGESTTAEKEGCAWGSNVVSARGCVVEEDEESGDRFLMDDDEEGGRGVMINGCDDVFDFDDYVLARFLGEI